MYRGPGNSRKPRFRLPQGHQALSPATRQRATGWHFIAQKQQTSVGSLPWRCSSRWRGCQQGGAGRRPAGQQTPPGQIASLPHAPFPPGEQYHSPSLYNEAPEHTTSKRQLTSVNSQSHPLPQGRRPLLPDSLRPETTLSTPLLSPCIHICWRGWSAAGGSVCNGRERDSGSPLTDARLSILRRKQPPSPVPINPSKQQV